MRDLRHLVTIFAAMLLPLAASACGGESYGQAERPEPMTESEVASFVGHGLGPSLERVPEGIAVSSLDLSSVVDAAPIDPSGVEPLTIIAACIAEPIPQMKAQQIYFGTVASAEATPRVRRAARNGDYRTNLDC